MAIIFALSAQPESAQKTGSLFGHYNYIVRKFAHLSEYAILFWLCRFAMDGSATEEKPERTLRMANSWGFNKINSSSFLLVALYAAGDEWHQSFVPGRTASIADVIIDCFGALIIWLLLAAIYASSSSLARCKTEAEKK